MKYFLPTTKNWLKEYFKFFIALIKWFQFLILCSQFLWRVSLQYIAFVVKSFDVSSWRCDVFTRCSWRQTKATSWHTVEPSWKWKRKQNHHWSCYLYYENWSSISIATTGRMGWIVALSFTKNFWRIIEINIWRGTFFTIIFYLDICALSWGKKMKEI